MNTTLNTIPYATSVSYVNLWGYRIYGTYEGRMPNTLGADMSYVCLPYTFKGEPYGSQVVPTSRIGIN
jgi:hypothetical protein